MSLQEEYERAQLVLAGIALKNGNRAALNDAARTIAKLRLHIEAIACPTTVRAKKRSAR
jgi:hypothetical protein